MLAFDDGAFARLMIAATAVAPEKRAAWLEEMAQCLDPSTSYRSSKSQKAPESSPCRGERQRRARQREREGLAVFTIVGHHDRLVSALIQSGCLSESAALRREAVNQALGQVLDEWSTRWAK
jgi:hypothetical protein